MTRKMIASLLALLMLSGCGSAETPEIREESISTPAIQQVEQPTEKPLPAPKEDTAEQEDPKEESPDQPARSEPADGQGHEPAPAIVEPEQQPQPVIVETAAQTTPSPILNKGTVFEGYAVAVNDWNTPAVWAGGKDWPITTWYFFDQSGNVLGSISGSAAMAITQRDPSGNTQWESWFAEAFNEYREVTGSAAAEDKNEPPAEIEYEESRCEESEEQYRPTMEADDDPAPDPEEWAMEVIELTNAEREKHGLHPLEVDDGLMELAMIRAEEVSVKYSHERPDGTRIATDLGYGENVGAKDSPEKQVSSWMSSDGHRRNILQERYIAIGVGCYQADDGHTYWVQVFSR